MSGHESTELTREALYELVWSKPIRTLAAEYGLSDVGLAKICKRAGVPRPGLGYWAKIAHGKTPKRLPLQPPKTGELLSVTITATGSATTSLGGASPPEIPTVTVSQRLTNPHPAIDVIRTAAAEREKNTSNQVVGVGGRRRPVLRVTAGVLPRAVRILDALAKAVEARGHTVKHMKVQEPGYGVAFDRLFVLEEGHEIHLSIVEKFDQVPHDPTAEERRKQAQYSFMTPPKFDQRPSGRLTLRLDGGYGGFSRSSWSDGQRQKLDDQLGRVVLAIEEGLAQKKQKEAEAEAWRRRYEDEQRRREREQRRQAYRQALEKDLRDMATRWTEADQVRAFLRAVNASTTDADRTASFTAWLNWATEYTVELDPLSKGASSVAKLLQQKEDEGQPRD